MRGNPFLGQVNGRCGDLTFYHRNGLLIGRTVNAHPHNPKTDGQVLARVILKTASCARAMLSSVASMSWQSASNQDECQGAFLKANIGRLRDEVDSSIGSVSDIYSSTLCNFLSRSARGCVYDAWQVSYGSLPAMNMSFIAGVPSLGPFSVPLPDAFTYADLADALGLVPDDVLHFLWCFVDDESPSGLFSASAYARVVLMPADGEIDGQFLDASGMVRSPNVANVGKAYYTRATDGQHLSASPFSLLYDGAGTSAALAACACVCERVGLSDLWSTERLALRPSGSSPGSLVQPHDVLPLSAAALSFA